MNLSSHILFCFEVFKESHGIYNLVGLGKAECACVFIFLITILILDFRNPYTRKHPVDSAMI